MEIPITYYLYLSIIVFTIGLTGVFLNRKNLIVLLMSIELILLSANINFVSFSNYYKSIAGQIFVFFNLSIAAAEAAVGLAILLSLYRNRSTIDMENFNLLKW